MVLVIVASLRLRRPDEVYDRMLRFWTQIFGVVFAGGVATGVVMEFEFGTNWASYSRFVGDIFGAPLAAEALIAFFLESSFLSILLFGEKRVSPRTHWLATLMVALGATLSAFWIVAANSWQQTPAGFHLVHGRAELTDFAAAVFNPSTPLRFLHAVLGSWVTAAVFVGSLSAYYLLRGRHQEFARRSLRLALLFGLVAIAAEVVVGDAHTRQVAHTQPEKFAAIEVLHHTQTGAPLAVVGQPLPEVLLPKLLSFMTYFDFDARVTGLDDFAPEDRPPVTATAMSFHAMLWLGLALGVVLGAGWVPLVARPFVRVATVPQGPLLLPADSLCRERVSAGSRLKSGGSRGACITCCAPKMPFLARCRRHMWRFRCCCSWSSTWDCWA